MFLSSVASAAPRNIEAVRTSDLIPSSIRGDAKTLVSLLESYYDHLNSEGLPSAEIGGLLSLKDIDLVSSKYFTQIEELIGKSIPNSVVLNKVELYKTIVKYYNTRGSEDSIHLFFKLFLNKVVEIIYPKEFLFDLSSGSGEWVDETTYEYSDNRSFASDSIKLYDGYFYQDYSYVIKSDLDSGIWLNDYLRFVHPSGLKLFTSIVIETFLRNEWNDKLDYTADNVNTSDWLKVLTPPHILDDRLFGYHSPKYQPGFLRDSFFKYIYTYLFNEEDQDLLRLVIFGYKFIFIPTKFRDEQVRERYLTTEKFIDPLQIGAGMLNKTIESADEVYSYTNQTRHLNISSFISITTTFGDSYYDENDTSPSSGWDIGEFYLDEGPTANNWDQGSVT